MKNDIILNDEERTICENWCRVMGYYRPYKTLDGGTRYNAGKQSEMNERVFFKE